MTQIKNIRNEDDFFIKYIKGNKPGQNYGASIFEDLMYEYRDLIGNTDYKGNYIFTNYLLYVYNETEFLNVNNESDATRIITNYFMTFNKITNQNDIKNYADLTILLDEWAEGNRQAHSIKSYYVLAKSLTGFDLLDGDGERQEHYNKTIKQPIFENIITRYINRDNGIETRGKGTLEDPYYSNNVYLGEFYFKIPKGKNKVYAKAIVNGTITLEYDLPNDFAAHIQSNTEFNRYIDINNNSLNGSNSKDFYNRGLLNDGNNEYLIEIEYTGTMDNNPRDVEVKLDFENCYDYKENRREFKSGIKWEASDDTIYPYVGEWQYNMSGMYYMPREVALTYYLGLNVSSDRQWLYNYLNSEAKTSACFSGFIDDSYFRKPLDVYGEMAGIVIDFADKITGMVFKNDPVARGFSKGMVFTGRVAFSIVHLSSAIGIAESILKFCLQVKATDDLISQDYIDKVGEHIYSYGIKDENGNTYITCEDSLCVGKAILKPFEFKEFTMSYDCMTWKDLRCAYGWKGVHGNFYE